MARDIDPASGLKDVGYVGLLVGSMLHHEQAVRGEYPSAIGRQNSNIVQSICSGCEGGQRLVAQVLKGFVAFTDVRWIGNDDIELLIGHRLCPGARNADDVRQISLADIFRGDSQGIWANVGCGNSAQQALRGDRYRDGAAASAEIEYLPFSLARNLAQRQLDQKLGLGSWYQRCGADKQLMRPEFFGSRDVRHGFAADTPLQQCLESIFGQVVEFVLRVCEEVAARHVNRLAQQNLGIKPR